MDVHSMNHFRRGAGWFAVGAAAAAGLAGAAHHYSSHSGRPAVPRPAVSLPGPAAQPNRFAPGIVILRFKDGALDRGRVIRDLGPDFEEQLDPDTHDVFLKFSPAIPEAAVVRSFRRDPGVVFAERDGYAFADYTPNDPHYDKDYPSSDGPLNQWHLKIIHAPEAWDHLRRISSSVRLAILDTGIDYTHPDLKNVMARDSKGEVVGADFTGEGGPLDGHGHGTHCAGIADAETDNGVGVSGVGFNSFKLVPVKCLSRRGQGQWDGIAKAITWAADNGCRVESMSLGSNMYSQGIQDAINYAWKKGVIIVAAAGNSSSSNPHYPAGCDHVVSVSATTRNDTLAGFSNYGSTVALGAPGLHVLATLPSYPCEITKGGRKQNYDSLSGTSMACPVVAGVMASLLAHQPTLKASEAIQRVERGADNIGRTEDGGWEMQFGHGRVNLANAILNRCRATRLGCFYGQVVDRDGMPVGGAAVTCDGLTVLARPDGMFRIANLPAGKFTLTASGSGGRGEAAGSVTVGADTGVDITVK